MLNAGSSEEVSDFGILSDRPCVRQRMQASASLSAAVRLFPVFVIMQEALAAAAAQYHSTGEGDLYPPGAHAIGHGAEHGEGVCWGGVGRALRGMPPTWLSAPLTGCKKGKKSRMKPRRHALMVSQVMLTMTYRTCIVDE